MKKLTHTFNAIGIFVILLSVVSAHGMEEYSNAQKLHDAAWSTTQSKNYDRVRELLPLPEAGPTCYTRRPWYKPGHFMTPLHIAAYEDNTDLLDVLLEGQKTEGRHTVNLQSILYTYDSAGFTPFHSAAYDGKARILRHLLKFNRCGRFFVNKSGSNTPLYYAAKNGHLETIRVLCDISNERQYYYPNDIKDLKSDMSKALLVAHAQRHKKVIDYLEVTLELPRVCEICVEEKNSNQFTILSCCSYNVSCTNCLLKLINTSLTERTVANILCPNRMCAQPIISQDMYAITLSNLDTYNKFLDIATHEHVVNEKDIRHCPTPDCKFSFINDEKLTQTFNCPQCKHVYCSMCLMQHTQEMNCEQAREHAQLTIKEELANKEWLQKNSKACPQCKTMVEKNGGCLTMFCKCKHQFCWKCLNPHDHTKNHPCGLWENVAQENQANQALIRRLAQGQPNIRNQQEQQRQLVIQRLIEEPFFIQRMAIYFVALQTEPNFWRQYWPTALLDSGISITGWIVTIIGLRMLNSYLGSLTNMPEF